MAHPNDLTPQLLDGAESITGRAQRAVDNATSAFGLVLGSFALDALTPEDIEPECKDQIGRICNDLAGIVLQAGKALQEATAAGLFDPTTVAQVGSAPMRFAPLALGAVDANGHSGPIPSDQAVVKGDVGGQVTGELAADTPGTPRSRESRYETDNPIYKGLLQGIANPETASPDFVVEILDDVTVRVGETVHRLSHHEVFLLNVLLLHRDEFIARNTWYEHGFHDQAPNEAAKSSAFTHAKRIFEKLAHPEGTVIMDNGKRAAALQYRIRDEVTVTDKRVKEDSGAAAVEDIPAVEVKKRTNT